MIEADTVCLLDFYVHEKVQRQGLGEDLFKSALKVSIWGRETESFQQSKAVPGRRHLDDRLN